MKTEIKMLEILYNKSKELIEKIHNLQTLNFIGLSKLKAQSKLLDEIYAEFISRTDDEAKRNRK